MLPWLRDDRPLPKCIYTRASMPGYVDPAQPPQKRKPFSSIRRLIWAHAVDITLPVEFLRSIQHELSNISHLKYAKVILKLSDILEGDFFNEYIKKGNVLMLSEGRPGIDNTFELREGHLHLSLDYATYERAGLQGQAVSDGGLKHKKNRFAIDLDLRQPSMLHGKKGFERIVWAAKNVLNLSLTWLFIDCAKIITASAATVHKEDNSSKMPIEAHQPRWFSLFATQSTVLNVDVPNIILTTKSSADSKSSTLEDDDFVASLDEWLSLLSLHSPLVQSSTPKSDPYICRYSPPEFISNAIETASTQKTDLATFRWQGFISSDAIVTILLESLKAIAPAKQVETHESGAWLAVQLHGFSRQSLTLHISRTQDGYECLEWDHGAP